MRIKPLSGKVLVKRTEVAEVTQGGIVVPHVAKRQHNEGLVLAVSNNNGPVSVGNKVLFGMYAGDEFRVEDEEYLILSEKDLLAIVEEELSHD